MLVRRPCLAPSGSAVAAILLLAGPGLGQDAAGATEPAVTAGAAEGGAGPGEAAHADEERDDVDDGDEDRASDAARSSPGGSPGEARGAPLPGDAPAPRATSEPGTSEPGTSEPAPEPPTSPGPGEPGPADDVPSDLPLELPPLDDELGELLAPTSLAERVAHSFGGIDVFGSGRFRVEVDDGRDLDPTPDLQTGVALTGRVGVGLPLGRHRARVVLGDGRRFGRDDGNLPGPFVPPDVLGFIYELNLQLDFPLVGLDTEIRLGRQEVTLADGRLVGSAPFDPRGRTLDGALARYDGEGWFAQGAAFYLGPLVPNDPSELSGLGLVSAGHDGDLALHESRWLQLAWGGEAYGLAHRDGTLTRIGLAPLTVLTAGARGHVSLASVTARGGLDAQVPVRDTSLLAPNGWGAHGEAEIEVAPELELFSVAGGPFAAAFVEVTGGVPVAGRTFRAPAPSVHRFLGDLDLVVTDNVASAGALVGVALSDLLRMQVAGRLLALTDPTGSLYDPQGRPVVRADPGRTERWAFTEVDAGLTVDLGYGVHVDAAYGIALPGPALDAVTPVQRLWVAISFDAELAASAAQADGDPAGSLDGP